MVEIELADERDTKASIRLARFLEAEGARRALGQPGTTGGGATTDQWFVAYGVPSGEEIEIWYDVWTGTSLRGPEEIVRDLARKFGSVSVDA